MVTKTDIAKYTLLPGILPRVFDIFRSGFAHVAYLLAVIYQGVRLLPRDHPYLDTRNFGRYGIRHVIAEAANHLVLDRKHIDQMIVFFMLLVGLVLLFAQFGMLIISLALGHPALAGDALDPTAMLGMPALGSDQDIAFILLDRVFGVPGFFDSCVSTGVDCTDLSGTAVPIGGGAFPWPFHIALHRLLGFYSTGIFIIGVLVIIYFVITIAAETAQSGTPFGQRFNKTWVPVRLILFLALLVPFDPGTYANGLNGAQLILLKVVQLSSNFATNGWVYFNAQAAGGGMASNSYMSQQQDLIATPNLGGTEIKDLLHFVAVVQTCREVHIAAEGPNTIIGAYIVRAPVVAGGFGGAPAGMDAARNNALEFSGATPYQAAIDFTVLGDLTIRFGQLAPIVGGAADEAFDAYRGNVKPLCGDLTMKVTDRGEPGSMKIQEGYYDILLDLWEDQDFNDNAACVLKQTTPFRSSNIVTNCADNFDENFMEMKMDTYVASFRAAIEDGIDEQRLNGLYDIPDELMKRGWAGAALWYNKIAEMNGAVTSASFNIPQVSKLPFLMEKQFQENQQQNSGVTNDNKFALGMSDIIGKNIRIDFDNPNEYDMLKAMLTTYNKWDHSRAVNAGTHGGSMGNLFVDYMNLIFGTSGLFEMRQNADVHPLAQLSALGKGMMDAVTRNAAVATSLKMGNGLLKITTNFDSAQAKMAGEFFFSMMSVTMGMSIVLYYVLPLMPFLYFMFAVSGWIKSIFEAMVAMPLWALAHLRIDGEGMMGPAALNGYMLILEVFLRPILIVSGLLASITIFSALVGVLNLIFDLVVSNVGGFDQELDAEIIAGGGPAGAMSQMQNAVAAVDTFFYTAMYAIICYMMGLASFKLVDLIPNQILRWIGASVSTFQEGAGDPVGKLTSQVQRGGILVTNQFRGRASGLAELG